MRTLTIALVSFAGTALAAAPHSGAPRYAYPKILPGGGCVYSVCVDLVRTGELGKKEQCFGAKVYRACTD